MEGSKYARSSGALAPPLTPHNSCSSALKAISYNHIRASMGVAYANAIEHRLR